MQLSSSQTTIKSMLFVFCCLIMVACHNKDTTDDLNKGRYPITHPERTPKSIPQTIEKPDIEEEFFEADKLK